MQSIGVHLESVRARSPLVHHITNWVTIADCATVVKVLGASPVMAHAADEAADMAALAGALVFNIGTLTRELVAAMLRAGRVANDRRIPIVLDVCGAGATPFRDWACCDLLDRLQIDVIKGNASEIARVAGEDVQTRGVDAGEVQADLQAVAAGLARRRDAVVVVTGPTDIVASREGTVLVRNGHPMMGRIVGTGCMAASVIGAFTAVAGEQYAAAAVAALACYGIAGEHAAAVATGPGSYRVALFDAVAALTPEQAVAEARLTVVGG